MVSVARKLSTIEWRENRVVCFGEEITGTKVRNPKTALGSSPGEGVGFRDNNFSYDIQRYVSNDQAYDKLLAITIYNKCEDLWNFPSVILRACC
jgi:hypothetical protein